jgi:holo-[acyl-carrier protein] synthase
MIDVRVGVDLTSIDAVEASLVRFGPRYTDRLFTARELEDSRGTLSARASSLAARFAAKEATIKALRVGHDAPEWTEIEVRRVPDGWCSLHLLGQAATLAQRAGLDQWSLALTHEANMAAAVVVAVGSGHGVDHDDTANDGEGA